MFCQENYKFNIGLESNTDWKAARSKKINRRVY